MGQPHKKNTNYLDLIRVSVELKSRTSKSMWDDQSSNLVPSNEHHLERALNELCRLAIYKPENKERAKPKLLIIKK